MKIIEYPETRQVFSFDCGANLLVSVLVFAGVEEREDRVALLAGRRRAGTSTAESCRRALLRSALPRPAADESSATCGGASTPAIPRC